MPSGYTDWFTNRGPRGEFGYVPPVEFEALHTLVSPPAEHLVTG